MLFTLFRCVQIMEYVIFCTMSTHGRKPEMQGKQYDNQMAEG